MDQSKASKLGSTFPTIKYNVNQDELEEFYSSDTEKSSNLEPPDISSKSKKSDKSGPSILDKYFKAFKADKILDDDSKSEIAKDISGRKSTEIPSEISGSPIKEYFSKFNKRSDSTETNSDLESTKESKDKDTSERWRLFSDFKVKIAQAVVDIKSSKINEGDLKDKIDITDLSDSEENSIHDLDPNSASTENQVSSIASSIQNLSDLSPPGISPSSTITDSEMESTSSESHLNLTPTIEKFDDNDAQKSKNSPATSSFHNKLENNDLNLEEIESGVDVLEDFELSKLSTTDAINDNIQDLKENVDIFKKPEIKVVVPQSYHIFTYSLFLLTFLLCSSLMLFPSYSMLNGIFIGIWITSVIHKVYMCILEMLGYNEVINYEVLKMTDYRDVTMSHVAQIMEFEPLKKYEGWINLYTYKTYDPALYHVSLTQTIFMKLEGSRLRMSLTHSHIPKRALWDEKEHKVTFYEHRTCNLEGAVIKLLPVGITKKRQWSKKYPICIILSEKSKIIVQSHISSETDLENINNEDTQQTLQYDKDDQGSNMPSSNCLNCIHLSHTKKDSPIKKNSPPKNDSPSKTSSSLKEVPILKSNKASLSKDIKTKKRKDEDLPKKSIIITDDIIDDNSDDDSDNDADNIKYVSQQKEFSLETKQSSKELFLSSDKEINQRQIFIFGRTGRQKSEWFQRLKCAIDDANILSNIENTALGTDSNNVNEESKDIDNTNVLEDENPKKDIEESQVQVENIKVEKKLIGSSDVPSVLWTPGGNQKDSNLATAFKNTQNIDFWRYMKNIMEKKHKNDTSTDEFLWFNAILGRIAFDSFRNTHWVAKIQERIQKKLSSLKLPSFMGPLLVTSLEMGGEAPQVHDASTPVLDSCGLWVDLQVSYSGHATMTLTTQLNLLSLKAKNIQIETLDKPETSNSPQTPLHKKVNQAVFESDLEDTAESSSEDEPDFSASHIAKPVVSSDTESPPANQLNVGNTPAKKLLRMVDKIASNKYFQHVTDYKYVKRALEEVSNTDLKLNVELNGLVGCFTINIPPPPSDRLWFGFRGSPHVLLKAKPIFGSRVINFGHITNWIEQKLIKEFEKILVYPNLEDIVIESMTPPVVD